MTQEESLLDYPTTAGYSTTLCLIYDMRNTTRQLNIDTSEIMYNIYGAFKEREVSTKLSGDVFVMRWRFRMMYEDKMDVMRQQKNWTMDALEGKRW